MSSQPFRTETGGVIDRDTPMAFRFDGRNYQGHPGDSLASALIANGVRLVGRSFKYHRPRGILSAGWEEPNALVMLGEGTHREPNIRATVAELYDGLVAAPQNAWPSLRFDAGALNDLLSPFFPAGFYYKTFIGGPKDAWTRIYEPVIRRMAGLGVAPTDPDPDRYDKRHAHCDVLVVGAGVAGLSAANAAAAGGARVFLVDEQPVPGGALKASVELIEGLAAPAWAAAAAKEFASRSNCRLLTRTTVFGRYDHGMAMAVERLTDHDPGLAGPRQRLWQIRAKAIILAAGAHEQPLVFANNDIPGIMLAHAAQTYARHYGALIGRRIVVGTVGESGYAAAEALAAAGAEIVAIVDGRRIRLCDSSLPVIQNAAIARAHGRNAVKSVDVQTASGQRQRLTCDAVLMSGGWQPALHLHSHCGGRSRYDGDLQCFVPANRIPGIVSVGGCNGSFALSDCLLEGRAGGMQAAGISGHRVPDAGAVPPPARSQGAEPVFHAPFALKSFIDFQNDVTSADVDLAAREGFVSVEHLKRYTTTGMATDQGKLSNLNALTRMSRHLGAAPGNVGTTTFRPPYTPVTFGTLAGFNVGPLMDPVRYTPMHDWHVSKGAMFENVGQWKRAWYYPRTGESMDETVRRECRAVRNGVGLFDASTLGKIDIRGRDVATFLNLVYTNAWSKLEVGRCRYGLMLSEDGMVMDDGVTIRTGPDRYLMTTTTGNAAPVMDHLEDLLQTEWPDLQVFLTSVSEHWAASVVTGPLARKVLERVVTGVDISNEAFPHLSMREGHIAGIAVRIYRISFTGELSYEVHVAAEHGLAVWSLLFEAGQVFGIMPYGTEATHVLRADKGYIIIGQETDGTVTPIDLGLDWAIAKSKLDFIGKRSLARPDTMAGDRKQLVGLRPVDNRTVLEEGAQLIEDARGTVPVAMLGHVTSSYWSDAAGGPIALALLRNGRARHGHIVQAFHAGKATACQVCEPLFYDKAGERINA
jgi:sarcosine oxidase subunit alpha